MTNENKPTSKVIQIQTFTQDRRSRTFITGNPAPIKVDCDEVAVLVALCENGSIWQLSDGKWSCILEAQTNDK